MKAQLTRRKLYDTAIALFLSKGYNKVTVDEICANAGASKGAFYTHFTSKYQIVVEGILTLGDYYRLTILPQIAGLKPGSEKILAFMRMMLRYTKELGKSSIQIVFYTQIGSDPKYTAIMTNKWPLYMMIHQLVMEGQEKGDLRNDLSGEQITQVIMHNIRGILYDWGLSTSEFDIEEAAEDLIKILATGFQKPKKVS